METTLYTMLLSQIVTKKVFNVMRVRLCLVCLLSRSVWLRNELSVDLLIRTQYLARLIHLQAETSLKKR